MSGEREYQFHGLNESTETTASDSHGQQGFNSKLSCCGVNLWAVSCGSSHCQCSAGSCCEAQASGSGRRFGYPYARLIIFGMANCVILALFVYFGVYSLQGVIGDTNKYRVCVVDGRGGFKRSGKYCPILDKSDSKVECVIGLDRSDCLRRISKGKVDFSVFTAEDLITATNSQIEVLITNEMRFSDQRFEYDVVAVVNDDAGINSKYDLRDKKLCHPGYGYDGEWTRILANFLEATVVPKSCIESLTLQENRIKASSEFFRAACKAGPWVSDDILDQELKRKYPNLCALCGTPGRCSTSDKYWGRRGPLFCLTDGLGDVSWVRLDDVQSHFGITPGAASANPEGYSFLCPDGSTRPVNTSNPCIWVSKPWPVIAAKRTSAQEIQRFINHLDHEDTDSWQNALLNLIESYHVDLHSVDPIQAIESYLINTPGFQSANSFTGCHPPRSIRICTTSIVENAKCKWMRETAAVYGIEPDFECLKADNKTHCLQAISLDLADVVLLPPDLVMTAKRDYNLKTLLYEDVKPEDRYETVAVVKKDSKIRKFQDLRNKKACFPSFEGIAWNSMLYEFQKLGLLSTTCPYSLKAANYFGDSCAPGVPDSAEKSSSLKKLCTSSSYEGDFGALKCLTLENADVAFVSKTSLKKLWAGHLSHEKWVRKLSSDNFRIICENEWKACELSWSTVGEIMIRASSSEMTFHETFDAFMKVDELFGANYKSVTRPFSMYGSFDGQHDVLFHDETVKLRDKQYFMRIEKSIPSYDDILKNVTTCVEASAENLRPSILFSVSFILFAYLLR